MARTFEIFQLDWTQHAVVLQLTAVMTQYYNVHKWCRQDKQFFNFFFRFKNTLKTQEHTDLFSPRTKTQGMRRTPRVRWPFLVWGASLLTSATPWIPKAVSKSQPWLRSKKVSHKQHFVSTGLNGSPRLHLLQSSKEFISSCGF